MATTPKFIGPDGVARETFTFTTTVPYRMFNGTMPANTVDMQVRIPGRVSGWTNDPDLIAFAGTEFIVPNPSAASGLQLLPGENRIEVRAILDDLSTTQPAVIQAHLSTEKDIGLPFDPPTGVYVERKDSVVVVHADGINDSHVQGYHVYASTEPGGGSTGYTRINPGMITAGDTFERTAELGTLEADANLVQNPDGSLAANPLFVDVQVTQRNNAGSLLQTDIHEGLPVPQNINRYRVQTTVSSVEVVKRFSFTHDRAATVNTAPYPALPNSAFTALPATDPLYYVVSAVYLVDGAEYESPLSVEVAGAPLVLAPDVGNLPALGQTEIVQATTLSIFRSQPQVDLKPGSVPRDTFIDPFAQEADRLRFIVDFLHNAQSFTTLLQIDDPTRSGTSIPVAQSPYKQALKRAFYLTSDDAAQTIIDNAFDRLAANYGKTRSLGLRSRGEITFVYPSAPASTLSFGIGTPVKGGSAVFRTTSFAQISPSGAGANFNPQTGRYTARAYIQAETVGVAGNLAAGQITSFSYPQAPGVTVTNESATFGGRDRESNLDLALRAQGALSSVDTGTAEGYGATAKDVPGVEEVNVVEAETPPHPLMQRDWDPVAGRHTGGKVDVWIRGSQEAPVTDTFAFPFGISKGKTFAVLGDPANLQFIVTDDASLTEATPLMEMLDHPELGSLYEFVNITQGTHLDLTDVQIIAYNIIQLSPDYPENNPANFDLLDIFQGSYRYRASDRHVFTQQPVKEITSFAGEESGAIPDSYYALYHPDSPLELGRSAFAQDYVKVTVPQGVTTMIPRSTPLAVTGEPHVMLDGIEYLLKLGVNPYSIRVYAPNPPGPDIEYIGPLSPPSSIPDYTFVEGDVATPLGIKLTSGSRIAQGQTVYVDYLYDENFTVAYTTNVLVGIAQGALDQERHSTADVVAKAAIEMPVDITATVVLKNKARIPLSDSSVRTEVTRLFGSVGLGNPLRPTDVDAAIKKGLDVSYVQLPMVKMTFGTGGAITLESLTVDEDRDLFHISAWDTPTAWTFLLGVQTPLEFATTDGGGPLNEYRGVRRDGTPLTLLDARPNKKGTPLKYKVGYAFIIGNDGMEIPGYDGETANRVLVTVPRGTTPRGSKFTVSYVVGADAQSRGLVPDPISYLVLGDLNLTYDEDQDFVARVQGRRA